MRPLPILCPSRVSASVQATGVIVLRWLAIGWVIVFWRLGYLALLDPDEAHYAQMTREMMAGRSWFVPLLDGMPFIDKPVLFHWLQALSITIFGHSEFALRMPSALATACLIGVVWWLTARLFEPSVGEDAALMFVTLPATFALSSLGLFDMVFAALLFSGVACLVVASLRARERLQYVGFPLLAVAVMIKGPVALVLVTLMFAAAWALGRTSRDAVRRLHWRSGLAFIVLAALPWFVWMSVTFGERFARDYLLAGNLWYFTAPPQFSTRVSDRLFYFRTFFGAFFPWSLIALGGAVDDVRARLKGQAPRQEVVWLWLWVVVVLLFFSAAGFKLDTYIFPAAPACAILAAVSWRRAVAEPDRYWTRAAVLVVAGVLTLGGAAAAVALFGIDLNLGVWTPLLPAVFIVGGAALLFQIREQQWRLPPSSRVLVVTLVVAFAVIVQIGFPLLESSRPTRLLGRWVAAHTDADASVGTYGLEDWHASIRYYADRPLRRLKTFEQVRAFLDEAPAAKVLMLQDDYRAMEKSGLEIEEVARRRAIVGRTGRVLRRQIWGQLVVVTRRGYAASLSPSERDLPESALQK